MRVSVLVTAYEHERYIAQALDGILEQDVDFSFEVLVGDDASTDGTRAVIAEYARAHPQTIRTFLPDTNLGLGGKAIFAELVERARGDFLAVLDGDDFWIEAGKLRRQVSYLEEHPECSMCFHEVLCRYEDGSRPDVPFTGVHDPAEVDMHQLLDGFQMGSCSPVFRRAAISPLPSWYFGVPWGDGPLYLLAAERGAIRYLPDVMAVYRIHDHGMYRGLSRRRALELRARYYEGIRVPPSFEAHRRRRLAESWVKLGLEHERLDDRPAARDCLSKSLAVQSFDPRDVRRGPGERRRMLLWLLLRLPRVVVHHPRLRVWRQSRAGNQPR